MGASNIFLSIRTNPGTLSIYINHYVCLSVCVRTKQILPKHNGRRANIVIDEEVDDYESDKEYGKSKHLFEQISKL